MPHDVNAIAARERHRLEAGASLDDVLRTLVDDELLGNIEVLLILMKIAPVGLFAARLLVEPWLANRTSLTHVRLPDLDRLGALVRPAGLPIVVKIAVIEGLARGVNRWRFVSRSEPEEARDHPVTQVEDLAALRQSLLALLADASNGIVVEKDDGASITVRLDGGVKAGLATA